MLTPILNEDVLRLELMDVDYALARRHIKDCATYLKFEIAGVKENVPYDIECIGIDALGLLHKHADQGIPRNPTDRYVTGVQFYFGYKDHKIFLLFQPLCMIWRKFDEATHKDLYKIHRQKDQTGNDCYYYHENNEFKLATANDRQTWINAYEQTIRIKHNKDRSEPHSPFDDNYDTQSIVFPFQTIFTLLFNNGSEELVIQNCIREVQYDADHCIKHCILLATDIVVPIGLFAGKYANRSHLCPPCNGVDVGYDLA